MHRPSNNSTYNIVINNLQNYMLTDYNINIISKKHQVFLDKINDVNLKNRIARKNLNIHKKKPVKETIKPNTSKDKIIYPQQNDSLFWCFYMMNNSVDEYFLISNKFFEIEKTFKFNAVDLVREKKVLIKQHKFKRTDIEDELANESKITLNAFFVLCLIYNKNIFVIKDNMYYELSLFPGEPIHVIHYNKNAEKYGIETNVSSEELKKYTESKWKVESLHKPMRAFSSYKLTDLYDICEKLCIQTETNTSGKVKKRKKQEIYQDILEKIEQ